MRGRSKPEVFGPAAQYFPNMAYSSHGLYGFQKLTVTDRTLAVDDYFAANTNRSPVE